VVTVIVGSRLGVEIAIIVSFCLVVGTCKLVCIWWGYMVYSILSSFIGIVIGEVNGGLWSLVCVCLGVG